MWCDLNKEKMSKFKKKNLKIQLDERENKDFIHYLSIKQRDIIILRILIDRDSLRFATLII